MWLRFRGYFHTAMPMLPYTGLEPTVKRLEQFPQIKPLPLILYRRFSHDPLPRFNGPLVRAMRGGNGFCVGLLFRRSRLDVDLLGDSEYFVWAPEDKMLLPVYPEATRISDELTRWLRGDVGWTAGPKQNVKLHDILVGFQPRWKRKPLTPQILGRVEP